MRKIGIALLCLLFPLMVYAKEDNLTIEEMDTYIMILDMDYYSYEETVNTHVVYGDNPNIYYYVKKIPKRMVYTYTGEEKSISYDVIARAIDIPNRYYDINLNDKNNYKLLIGSDNALLNENDSIKISYLTEYSGDKLKNNKEYHFDIAKSDYDIKKVNFEIILSDKAKRGTIYFSNNGKDYSKELEGLTYKKDAYSGLQGEYTKVLKKGDSLSIKITLSEEDRKIKLDFEEVIVYCSFGILIVFIIFIIYKVRNHKKK